MKMAKALLFLATCLALLAPSHAVGAETPVSKIVKLLQGLTDKVEKEGEKEEDLFNKYSCWAQDSMDDKKEAIAEANDKIAALDARIAEIASEASKTQQDIERVKKGIEDNVQLVQRANATRAKESSEAAQQITDMNASLVGMSDALDLLMDKDDKKLLLMSLRGKRGRDAMQKYSAAVKKALTVTKYLSNGDAAFLRSLFEHKQPSKDDLEKIHKLKKDLTADKAVSRESAVIDVVDQMKGKTKKEYDEAVATETKAASDHVALVAEKASEKHDSEQELKMLEEDTARRDYDTQVAQDEKKALQDQNTIDQDIIEKLEAALKTKTEEWDARSAVRQDELTALSKATAMLNDQEQSHLFRKAYSSADSFLQEVSVSSREVRISASQALNKAGHASGQVQVLALAAKLSGTGADFTEVLAEIDKMVKAIDDEHASDKSKKETCEKELAENTQTKEDTDAALKTAAENIESLEEKIAADIKALEEYAAKVASLEQETGKASVQRQKEHEEYLENRQVDQDAKALLISATEVVKGFFEKKAALLQVRTSEDPVDKDAPETWGSSYEGSKEAGGSIIDTMNQAKQDLEADMAKAATCETNAIKMYQDAMDGFKSAKNNLETKLIVDQEAEKASHEESLAAETKTNSTKTQELLEVKKQMAEVKPGCDFYIDNWEKREANRKEEKEGLETAKQVMKDYNK